MNKLSRTRAVKQVEPVGTVGFQLHAICPDHRGAISCQKCSHRQLPSKMANICRDWLTDRPTDCCIVVIGHPRYPAIRCSAAKNKSSWSAKFVVSYRCLQLFTFTALASTVSRRIFIYIRGHETISQLTAVISVK